MQASECVLYSGAAQGAEAAFGAAAERHGVEEVNFTFEGLKQAEESRKRLDDFIQSLNTTRFEEGPDPETTALADQAKEEFKKAMDEDLNLSGGLGALFQMVKSVNARISAGNVSKEGADYVLETLRSLDSVFGIMGDYFSEAAVVTLALSDASTLQVHSTFEVPEAILEKIKRRQEARKGKDFAAADSLRDELKKEGFTLEDIPEGIRVKRR